MKWSPFEFNDQVYDLSHLHDLEFDIVQPAKEGKPARQYSILVEFSLHCFSTKIKPGDSRDLRISDSRESRTFSFERYGLSKNLPEIMPRIVDLTCRNTGKDNFLIIETVDEAGNDVEYEIFFSASKVKREGKKRIRLYVESAYVRRPGSREYRPRSKKSRKISIFVIAHNTLHGKQIRA